MFFFKKTSSYRHDVSALPEPPPGGGGRGAREADLGVASHSHEHPEAVLEDAAEVAHQALLPLFRSSERANLGGFSGPLEKPSKITIT